MFYLSELVTLRGEGQSGLQGGSQTLFVCEVDPIRYLGRIQDRYIRPCSRQPATVRETNFPDD